MGALLKIVQSPAANAKASAITVLNADLVDRLTKMNSVARMLRAMGYHVVREELRAGSVRGPVIEIARDRMESLIPLLDRAAFAGSRPSWAMTLDKPRFMIGLMGVTVMCEWIEA